MAKNMYTNVANIAPLPDFQGEAEPKTAIFASIVGENVTFDIEGVLRYPININSLTSQPLNELARHVLGIIGSYEFVTAKMIIDCLSVLGIQTDSKHVLTATERLRKTGLIHAFRFKNETEEKTANYIVYTLSKLGGENALHSLGVSISQIDNYNVVMDPALVKKKLAINQILFAHLKRNSVDSFEKSKRYTVADISTEENITVRPSLVIRFKDNSSLFYEVVRKSAFWETEFENKLLRYKKMQDNWTLPYDIPHLIICCEDEEHARLVNQMVSRIDLRAFFTHDLLFFGNSFESHLFTINHAGESVFFKIAFDEAEKGEAC